MVALLIIVGMFFIAILGLFIYLVIGSGQLRRELDELNNDDMDYFR